MKPLFSDEKCEVYMNSSCEFFIKNKKDGTTLRMAVDTRIGGVSVATGYDKVMRTTRYGANDGLNFKKVQ